MATLQHKMTENISIMDSLTKYLDSNAKINGAPAACISCDNA